VPRSMSYNLDQLQLRSELRRPAFQILIYDVASTADTIGTIVRELGLNFTTGPRDFTADIVQVEIEERAGDFVDAGIGGMTIVATVTDPHNIFDPLNFLASPSGDGRWLRRGNVVRIREGDLGVPAQEWITTFTGEIVGQAGVERHRGPAASITFKAVSREVGFLKYKNTSQLFANGASYLSLATTIAQNDMQLDASEIVFTGFGATLTALTSTQFVDEEPLVSVARVMFTDGFMPRFTGEGKLGQTEGQVTREPDRFYDDDTIIRSIIRPFSEIDPVNQVTIVGLDSTTSEVKQPRQVLAEVSVTTGFFTQDERIDVYWSKDRSVVALNPHLKVLLSVNAGLNPLGGGESMVTIPAESGYGTIGATIEIGTGFAAGLVVFLGITYVGLSALPDFGEGVGAVVVEKVGSLVAAIALAAALMLMTKIGRGKYEVTGEPVEFIFKELRAIAKVAGTLSQDVNEVVIENHLVSSQSMADNLAREVLFRQQARGNPRSVEMLHDLRLEPDDIFQVASGRKFLIDSIRRALVRTPSEAAGMVQLSVFEVTPGFPS